jgi:hypothetical protein
MKNIISALMMCFLFLVTQAVIWGDVEILNYGSTGLATDGLTGYLGELHPQDRIVVTSDESVAYLLFYWDSTDLQPVATVTDKAGFKKGEFDLTKENYVTLEKPGEYVCMLSTRKGSGHWFCVVMSGREWNP